MPRLPLSLALVLSGLAGCAVGPDLPPRSEATGGPAPTLVDLTTLPGPGTAENPGPDLLQRADGIRGG